MQCGDRPRRVPPTLREQSGGNGAGVNGSGLAWNSISFCAILIVIIGIHRLGIIYFPVLQTSLCAAPKKQTEVCRTESRQKPCRALRHPEKIFRTF